MKRPGVAQKKLATPLHEPDLTAISQLHPVPEALAKDDESNVLLTECTLQGGPKARMPIYTGAASILTATASRDTIPKPPALQQVQQEHQKEQQALLIQQQQQQAVLANQNQHFKPAARPIADFGNSGSRRLPTPSQLPRPSLATSAAAVARMPQPQQLQMASLQQQHTISQEQQQHQQQLAAWANMAAQVVQSQQAAAQAQAEAQATAASQFAAGFAAATAYSQQQFRNVLANLAAAQQQQQPHQDQSHEPQKNPPAPP